LFDCRRKTEEEEGGISLPVLKATGGKRSSRDRGRKKVLEGGKG